MRTTNDVLRSLGIYLASSLGAEWEVRFGEMEGDFSRPFCRVESATPFSPRVWGGGVTAEYKQSFSVVCYPAEKDDNEHARLEAGRVEELLNIAFARGTREDSFGRKQGLGLPDVSYQRGHPLRVPLWDCEGIALDEPVPDDARDPRDFARVDQEPTFQTLEGSSRDDEAETLYSVVGTVRLSWTRSLAILTPATPVASVPVKYRTPDSE